MSELIIPQRKIILLSDPVGRGSGPVAPQAPAPQEEEISPWDQVQQHSDAVELIGEVKAEAEATIEALKKADNQPGSGDIFPDKEGQVAVVRQEVDADGGVGFRPDRKIEHVDSYLDFDPKSGTINEFRSRNVEQGTSMSIIREEDAVVYSAVGEGWQKVAVQYDDGTYEFAKSPHLDEETKAAMALNAAMQMQMGGGGDIF